MSESTRCEADNSFIGTVRSVGAHDHILVARVEGKAFEPEAVPTTES